MSEDRGKHQGCIWFGWSASTGAFPAHLLRQCKNWAHNFLFDRSILLMNGREIFCAQYSLRQSAFPCFHCLCAMCVRNRMECVIGNGIFIRNWVRIYALVRLVVHGNLSIRGQHHISNASTQCLSRAKMVHVSAQYRKMFWYQFLPSSRCSLNGSLHLWPSRFAF